jgi:hypothetical protein
MTKSNVLDTFPTLLAADASAGSGHPVDGDQADSSGPSTVVAVHDLLSQWRHLSDGTTRGHAGHVTADLEAAVLLARRARGMPPEFPSLGTEPVRMSPARFRLRGLRLAESIRQAADGITAMLADGGPDLVARQRWAEAALRLVKAAGCLEEWMREARDCQQLVKLTAPRLAVLGALDASAGPMRVTDLVAAARLGSSAVQQILSRMVAWDWVVRTYPRARQPHFALTALGRYRAQTLGVDTSPQQQARGSIGAGSGPQARARAVHVVRGWS